MTQPVQEPATQRSIAAGTWNTNQLYRRPAPQAPAAVPVEWITFQSTTNWDAGVFTDLSFTYLNGNYDSTTPTFDVISGVPKIYRSGAYEFRMTIINITSASPDETIARATLTRTAGAIPFIINYDPDQQLVYPKDSTLPLVTPWWSGLLLYSGSAGSLFGTPSSFNVSVGNYTAGVLVADSSAYVSLTFVRLGDAYS